MARKKRRSGGNPKIPARRPHALQNQAVATGLRMID
jgi:hypothetical protein